MYKKFLILIVILQLILVGQSALLVRPNFPWESEIALGTGVRIKWIGSDKEWLTMEMAAPTKGYVAIGFSSTGAMKGSDIVMGWVESDGKAYIKDLHGIGNEVPLEDSENDYEILWGEENEENTTIVFRRKWITCDVKEDYAIKSETVRLLWSYGKDDPENNPFKPLYHGHDNRGIRSVVLKDYSYLKIEFPSEENPPEGMKFWDILMENNTVNEEDTTYFCKIYKAPHLDKKHQMIGFRALIEPHNYEFVHHMLLYECIVPPEMGGSDSTFEKHLNHPGARCFTENMPPEWAQFCLSIPVTWAVGHDGLMYPEHVGIPLGEMHGGVNYFLIEMHYDNPKNKSFVDSSGLRIYVTDKLREYDLNSILVGHRFSPFNTIPHGLTSFKTSSICPAECTLREIPKEGITAFQAFPHGHTTVTAMTLRHIRNGVELEPMVEETNFDFNYQQARIFPKPIQIMPGDDLILECDTTTKKETRIFFGGIQTREEMCIAYIYYYPRISLGECRSDLEFNTFFNALGITEVKGEILDRLGLPYTPKEGQQFDPADITAMLQSDKDRMKTYERANIFDYVQVVQPENLAGKTVGDVLYDIKWTDDEEKIGKETNKKWLDGDYYAFCSHEGRIRVPIENYTTKLPQYTPFVSDDDRYCESKKHEIFQTKFDALKSGVERKMVSYFVGFLAVLFQIVW